jgi:hypothetical protein
LKEGALGTSNYGTVSRDCQEILGDYKATLLSEIPKGDKRAFNSFKCCPCSELTIISTITTVNEYAAITVTARSAN